MCNNDCHVSMLFALLQICCCCVVNIHVVLASDFCICCIEEPLGRDGVFIVYASIARHISSRVEWKFCILMGVYNMYMYPNISTKLCYVCRRKFIKNTHDHCSLVWLSFCLMSTFLWSNNKLIDICSCAIYDCVYVCMCV